MSKRVYLAGPEVFLADAKEIGKKKKGLCRKYGFEGVFPIDVEVDGEGKTARELGLCISSINEELIRSCEIVVANITPFRGPSADVGTVYEMGYAHGLGKKVYAYTNLSASFTERTVKALGDQVNRGVDGKLRDRWGMFIEEVELTDNLMVDGCIYANGKVLVIEEAPENELFTYLGGFERLLRQIQSQHGL
ncbi:MAG: nucleoside 2-deoxyribosyltransferase [Candidatus Bathyarchaeota archaeon]|nr:nucleoside 2-deoxyribosyltransferase [Candidatus Bathyarchaeota archaeon]